MELQLIMDAGSESLGGAMWLTSSMSPTYQQLSPGRPGECDTIIGQQVSTLYLHRHSQISMYAIRETERPWVRLRLVSSRLIGLSTYVC